MLHHNEWIAAFLFAAAQVLEGQRKEKPYSRLLARPRLPEPLMAPSARLVRAAAERGTFTVGGGSPPGRRKQDRTTEYEEEMSRTNKQIYKIKSKKKKK